MPLYKSGCKSPIYDYSTGNGGAKPPMTDHWPADVITRKLPKPMGERRDYDGRTAPNFSESGANFRSKPGKSTTPGLTSHSFGPPASPGAGRRAPQDAFQRHFGKIGSGARDDTARGDRGMAIGKDMNGRTIRTGRSG